MSELKQLRQSISLMARTALEMWQLTHQSFMEHDLDLFNTILERENKLNDWEKELTQQLIKIGNDPLFRADERSKIAFYANIIGDLELIGDYCKDMLERIHIKIEEKLLFSEDAVKEYNDLYQRTEDALEEVVTALEKDRPSLLKEALKQEAHIDKLVDQYRANHNQRLLAGVCSPFAGNMFLNMLDFTAAVYYHTKKVARNLKKISL